MQKPLAVIKYGSASVTDDSGMDVYRLSHHAAQVALLAHDYRIIIVSSGSVAAGRSIWARQGAQRQADQQTLAMLGSAEAAMAWQRALREHGLLASQLLVTHREISAMDGNDTLTKALQANLQHDVIPIINENDAISESELAKLAYGGDNDGLGSHMAVALRARTLLLLTEAEGVLNGQNQRLRQVAATTDAHQHAKSLAYGSNGKGRGGMASKIDAAIQAAQAGIESYIGAADASVDDIISGKTGTKFAPNPVQ